MKAGVPGFSYAGFDHFAHALNSVGYYTSNLGDNAQTVAARSAWKSVGWSDENIVVVDRDTLPSYAGPPVALLMNAVFQARHLPAPPSVTPVFLGFCTDALSVAQHADWLRSHAPIGCRDPQTVAHCHAHGIEAFVSGCVTLTLQPRPHPPQHGRLFVVLGWRDLLPPTVFKHIPTALLDTIEVIHHRHVEGTIPLTPAEQTVNEAFERHLLQRYAEEASLVLTPLLHVASPCAAMNVPVVLCRWENDTRFGMMESLMPIYLPDRLHEIDWSPRPPDVTAWARAYLERLMAWRPEAVARAV